MFTIIGILIILISVLLTFIVLIQNPKGGGVSSAFGGVSNQILGAGKTTDVVEKITWGLAASLIVFCLASILVVPSSNGNVLSGKNEVEKSELEKALDEGIKPSTSTQIQTPMLNTNSSITTPATSTPATPATPAANTTTPNTEVPAKK